MEYTLQDKKLMQAAIDCGKKCTSVESAYNVGAVIADANGTILSTGYSRQLPGNTHAEQCALLNLPDNQNLADVALYTTMEPCSKRLSGNVPCVALILQSGIKRVFVGIREPPNFVNCMGVEELQAEGVEVTYVSELEDECRKLNCHLTG